jgi:hypothetical protein
LIKAVTFDGFGTLVVLDRPFARLQQALRAKGRERA